MRSMICILGPLTVTTCRASAANMKRRKPLMSSSSNGTKRIAIVTGASSGIGLHTVLGLVRAGMRVVMLGRDRTRTEAARGFVREHSGCDGIDILLADFSRLADVRRVADEILSAHDQIDLLINNAGLMSRHYRFSFDGFELTFAVNHLAPLLLTYLLLDRLKASAPARIINVAYEAHSGHRLNFSDLSRPQDWGTLRAYGRSKLCHILFPRELAMRLDSSGVVATCLPPGAVATAFGQRGGVTELVWRLMKPFMKSPEEGAETSLFLATVSGPTPFHGGFGIWN